MNPIEKLSVLLTSKELSNQSIEVLNFSMARICDKVKDFTIFLSAKAF